MPNVHHRKRKFVSFLLRFFQNNKQIILNRYFNACKRQCPIQGKTGYMQRDRDYAITFIEKRQGLFCFWFVLSKYSSAVSLIFI